MKRLVLPAQNHETMRKKNIFIKNLFALTLLCLLTAIITGCGGKDGTNSNLPAFSCKEIDNDVMAVKIDTETALPKGSTISVAEGQAAVIVDQGNIVQCYTKPGDYTYEPSSAPLYEIANQKTKDHSIYFLNTNDIIGLKGGTANALPFVDYDEETGINTVVSYAVAFDYAYQISDPARFLATVGDGIALSFTRQEVERQLNALIIHKLSGEYSEFSGTKRAEEVLKSGSITMDVTEAIKKEKWEEEYGFTITSFAIANILIAP